jgi:hypothetical protein
MTKRQWLIIAAVVVIGSAITGGWVYSKNKSNDTASSMNHGNMAMNDTSGSDYKVNLMSGESYTSNKPTTLHFDVEQNGTVYKNFAIDSTKLMHLIVVRKDRYYFQHVHPAFDEKTGMFTMDSFQFPTDGQYRVFANFAPTDAKKDMMGMIETEAPYRDVNVGDVSKVAVQPLGPDKLTSTANGLTASVVTAPGDDSPTTTSQPIFYAGQDGSVEVAITKNGMPFKNLQEYLGNLGHMVILGSNLEFIHAHPMVNDLTNQTGYIPFMVTLPKLYQYKLYLQTQANDIVSTFDFNITTKEMPKSTSSNDSMQGIDHMSH